METSPRAACRSCWLGAINDKQNSHANNKKQKQKNDIKLHEPGAEHSNKSPPDCTILGVAHVPATASWTIAAARHSSASISMIMIFSGVRSFVLKRLEQISGSAIIRCDASGGLRLGFRRRGAAWCVLGCVVDVVPWCVWRDVQFRNSAEKLD